MLLEFLFARFAHPGALQLTILSFLREGSGQYFVLILIHIVTRNEKLCKIY